MKTRQHLTRCLAFLLFAWLSSVHAYAQAIHTVWLDELPVQTFSEGIRPVSSKTNYVHDSMRIHGRYFDRGVGVQSISILPFYLGNKARRFTAEVGADDSANQEIAVTFYVIGDKKILYQSKEMKAGDPAEQVDVDLTGIERVGLLVTDKVGGSNNKRTYANWANARLVMLENEQPQYIPNNEKKYILTPRPPDQPHINSPKIFGATPGNPFLFTIAVTGKRPVRISADSLPQGLSLDQSSGLITGYVKQRGVYRTSINAVNSAGSTKRPLTIYIGDTIALTPPMGWNGWNAWEQSISKEKVMASAKAMVEKGLRDHGWTYVNIDDAWQGVRGGPDTSLQPNEKFPDMKEMISYIHSLGLKAGLYSTPYMGSYGGFVGGSSAFPAGGETHAFIAANRPKGIGKYRFENEDAKQMAEWGVDFLKYDWRIDVNSTERMSRALRSSGRDMVFSISNSAPFDKVNDWMRLTNMYRTGPDIKDSWASLYQLAFTLDKWSPYGGHGHWNDPDMMIVGKVAIGPVLHDTRLTPDEQYSHISIFSLLAAPLLIGCPIEQLDDFTLNLLTNDEVIAISQDPLGIPARLIRDTNGIMVWKKPMEDGSIVLGLFNVDDYGKTPQSYFHWGNEKEKSYAIQFKDIGMEGKWKLRDVWRQKNLKTSKGLFKTTIPHHGVVLLRCYADK